jgi:serine/threonine protein kinase
MSKEYGPPIDVWSYGCIFAEILMMLDKKERKREFLFKGNFCSTLSPASELTLYYGHLPINF